MAQPSLLDIVIQNNAEGVASLIDETTKAHPEVRLGAARSIAGILYKTLVRTALPATTGIFRDANEGATIVKSTYENRTVECFIADVPWQCDKAVADSHEDGAEAYIAIEAEGTLEGAIQALASQMYYGISASAKGFAGLVAQVNAAMVVDATGSSAGTGSSVWGVRWGPRDVQWVLGSGGDFAVDDYYEQRITQSNGKVYTAYCQGLLARIGLQVGSIYSIGQIKDCTEDSGKGLTDALIAQLIEKFPAGRAPDVLYMNRRSRRQLQSSRTATNPTGAPAPFPSESLGVPIEVTDAITSTETLS